MNRAPFWGPIYFLVRMRLKHESQPFEISCEHCRLIQGTCQDQGTLNAADDIFRHCARCCRLVSAAGQSLRQRRYPIGEIAFHGRGKAIPRIIEGKDADQANAATSAEVFFDRRKHMLDAGLRISRFVQWLIDIALKPVIDFGKDDARHLFFATWEEVIEAALAEASLLGDGREAGTFKSMLPEDLAEERYQAVALGPVLCQAYRPRSESPG